jgi:CRISPR/Cas system Type II protein with McrA/HNH and RuvC-like nuclease domain
MNSKKCTKCQIEKPLESFGQDSHKLNKRSHCKACCNEAAQIRRLNNIEHYRLIDKKCREKTKIKRNERSRIRAKKHRLRYLANTCNRYSGFKSDGKKITALQLFSLAKKQKLICPISGIKLDSNNISADHITPFDKGGKNTIDNIQLVIWEVNQMKNSHSLSDFLNLIKIIYAHQSTLSK